MALCAFNLFPEASGDHELAAGLDEAGRGCLAGPVVAAAVILPADYSLPGLDDSKKLSRRKREFLEPLIKKQALAWSLGAVWQRRIELVNIARASLEAMAKAAAHLKMAPDMLLVDGVGKIPADILRECWSAKQPRKPPAQMAIVGGDAKVPAISAASIIAKTFRDRLMVKFGRRWPEYGFERHMGYGVGEHLRALAKYGPCPIHRLTFRGVRAENGGQHSLC